MSTEKYNKEQIRNRMLKFAAAFQGIQKAENFDPVVKLLIEALANEMYMLGEDFMSIESRLLEKTARMLTPGILLSPSPAHAVIHASPIETTYPFKKDKGIYYDNNTLGQNNQVGTLYFYPSCNTLLHKGDVKYLISGDLLYQVSAGLEKTMIARTEKRIDSSATWIGLSIDEQIKDLKDLSFYLEFPNVTDSYEYLYLLSCTEWFIHNRKVDMRRGIYEEQQQYGNNTMAFFSNYELINAIDRETTELYKNHFLTVDCHVDAGDKEFLPGELKDYFSESDMCKVKEKLVWIKVQYPSIFTNNILDDIHIGINVVPIENKQLYESVIGIEDTFGIIPLITGANEHLLSVYSVRSGKGQVFHELSYNNNQEEDKQYGTYSIRKGGCERFDSRSAKDLLCYLGDLLNNESNAFGSFQSEGLRSLARQMDVLLAQMKQIYDTMQESRNIPYYLMIDQLKGNEQITVQYWVTKGEAGNGLRAGMEMSPNTDTFVNPKELILISSTYGGKEEPKENERVNLYQYELTSRSRILTNDDISNFCKKELGELLEGIRISNGVDISKFPNEGLIRTKDIHLRIKSQSTEPALQERLKGDLKFKLTDRSPDTFNYRIFIEK